MQCRCREFAGWRCHRLTPPVKGITMLKRFASLFALALIVALLPAAAAPAQVTGTDVLYTDDADFDLGTLVSVNHDSPFNDRLQLDSPTEPFPFINVAASGRGTVVRINTETGEVVGEYRTAPEGRGLNPSRTTVDLFGNVWTANREEVAEIDGIPAGSAVKIGLIVGGMRVDETGVPNPSGDYLAPPFGYSTCVDRNGDGLIRTSGGLLDVLDWPDVTDGVGGADGLVEDAVDECTLIYQRLPDAEQARHVSVDADNNVWVGGYPFDLRYFYKLDGSTGAFLDSFDARAIGCGGYGGLIDGNGVLWSIGWGTEEGALLRYDPATGEGSCVNIFGGYGLGIDTNGYVWGSIWENGISKVSPDGILEPGFPKSTTPPSSAAAAGFSPGSLQAIAIPLSVPTTVSASPAGLSVAGVLAANVSLAEAVPVPSFVAHPPSAVESSGLWTPGATISLTIEDGSGTIYSDSQTADGSGYFHFDLGGFELEGGHVVTVSDGTTTKVHTVGHLFVTGIDVTGDVVSGTGDPGADMEVWSHDGGLLFPTVDASGNWSADFSGVTDLTYASEGVASQLDDDGDATWVFWTPPQIVAHPPSAVESSGLWTPGATISLTIEDGSGTIYSDSQTADGSGYFHFDLGGFELEGGHVVTVSDGTTTKVHTVGHLFVTGIDVTGDVVSGTGDPGADMEVWSHDGGLLFPTVDASGNWSADFSGVTDLTYASEGVASQLDDDGDATWVFWASPAFQVAPDDDWVQSQSAWTPGATISLTIADGSGVVYSDSQTADGAGNFNFNLWEVFDLRRGHVVAVSDGTTTKTHTVMNLYVDGINLAADTVFGRANPGQPVDVWVHDNGNVSATADGSGNWVADFSGLTDLTYASDGGSQVSDDDGDSTGVWWATPAFVAAPDEDWVQSSRRWASGGSISLTIADGSGVVYSDSQVADGWGNFNFNLWEVFDLQRGHVVTVSDGTTTKTHTVMDLFADRVDIDADTVSGTADAGTEVNVWVNGDGAMNVVADGSGDWEADFSAMADLTGASNGGAHQWDDDGDLTQVGWQLPSFQVAPNEGRVESTSRWTPGATIALTIEDASGVVYSDSQTADGFGELPI